MNSFRGGKNALSLKKRCKCHVEISLHHSYKSNLKWWKWQIKNFCCYCSGWGQFLIDCNRPDDVCNLRILFSTFILAAAAKSLQSCPTLCDPIYGSPPGCPIPGILQARTLEWVAISFSNAWKWKVKVKSLSRVRLLATPWTAAHQAPPSMGFSRQECQSGAPLPSPSFW